MRFGFTVAALAIVACSKPEATPQTPAASSSATTATTGPAATVASGARLGKPAPDFTLPSLAGSEVSLASHQGKTVVLEWFNPDCPFVRQAHQEGSLDGMAAQLDDVVWLAVNSGGPGKQGASPERNRAGKDRFDIGYPILLDGDGKVGKLYGAERTPHMYVNDPSGKLVYRGAIDNSGGGDVEDVEKLVNYVSVAISDIAAKRPVRTPETEAWGCTVKYAR